MPLELRPLTREDAVQAAGLICESYKNNPFRRIVMPNGMGQASLDKLIDSQLKAADDPDKYLMKVVDTTTGEMAACACWQHSKAMSDEDWDREMERPTDERPDTRKDLIEPFIIKSREAKRRVMNSGRWWELLALNTLPKYQRQGVGSMLMEWGNKKQEEMKLPGFIEATVQGYGLYLKHGYREMERWEFDLGNWSQWGGSGMYMNAYLVRELPGSTVP